MFAIERMKKIKEKLLKEKRVDVFELSELFSVTEVTIRRDLDKLEQEGFLIKTYGGAVLNDRIIENSPKENISEVSDENKMIGKIAAEMIEDDEAIYLSPGIVSLEIAKNIKDKRVTIVTNDLLIGCELRNCVGIKVIITGGNLIQSTYTLVGGFALQSLRGIFINKAFIFVKGINFDSGYTLDSFEEIMVIQEVQKISNDFIIIADYNRFNSTSFAKLGDLTIAKKVITNKKVPSEYKKFFFENSIKLYTAYEFK
jgi:DeoR family transcriptional regulator, fructose operon transcriptional repressor